MAHKPTLTEDTAKELFFENYDRVVIKISSLPSYDDRNFLITTNDGKFLFKIFNGELSANTGRCNEQCMLQHMWSESGIMVPKVIPDKNGSLQITKKLAVANGESENCILRVLGYLEGNICQKLPVCQQFYEAIGSCCSKQHKLMGIHSKDFPTLNALQHEWTLESVIDDKWHLKIPTIDNEETKQNVYTVINEFKKFMKSNTAKQLRSGVIHCDLNSLNIIGEATNSGVILKGIIDFGDVCHSRFVFDLAICIIYMMVAVIAQNPEGNFYEAASWVLKGYQEVIQLSNDELQVLFLAIKTRAAQSVIGAYYTVSIEPENREYLMSEAGQAEILLNKLSKITNENFLKLVC